MNRTRNEIESALTLSDLLKIEDDPQILSWQCSYTGLSIWPQVRVHFFRMLLADLLYNSADDVAGLEHKPTKRAICTLGRAFIHNVWLNIRGPIQSELFINTEAVGDQLEGGRWFNRYVDDFGDLLNEQPIVLTNLFEWEWHVPRHNPRIYVHAPMQVAHALRARLTVRRQQLEQAADLVDFVGARAHSLIGWQMGANRRQAFINHVAARMATCGARYTAYQRLLRRVRPKLLLGSSHCYGFHAPLVAAAREMGAVIAEYQHGAISRGHDAYNFAPAIREHPHLRRALPDYLLTYGEWWAGQTNAPVEKVAIGNPGRARRLSGFTDNSCSRDRILLLSDGFEFDLYRSLAAKLAQRLENHGFSVAIRPHPSERNAVAAKWGCRIGNVEIDEHTDILQSFASASAVISEVSTGLFDAVGLVDHVLMLDTAKARFAYPQYPFAKISSAQDVVELLTGRQTSKVGVSADQIWSDGWQKRFVQFLAEKVGIS